MEHNRASNHAAAFGVSLAVASLANALLVTAKEKNPKVLAFMKGFTGHHWITHCVFIIGIFIVLGWLLTRVNGGTGIRLTFSNLIVILVGGVLLGAATIVGFYLIEG